METYSNENERYERAVKRVKKIKGFYKHALIYVFVNAFIIISNVYFSNIAFDGINRFYTPIFWGFGLLAHGLSVFIPESILGSDWEERKINEIMRKNH